MHIYTKKGVYNIYILAMGKIIETIGLSHSQYRKVKEMGSILIVWQFLKFQNFINANLSFENIPGKGA